MDLEHRIQLIAKEGSVEEFKNPCRKQFQTYLEELDPAHGSLLLEKIKEIHNYKTLCAKVRELSQSLEDGDHSVVEHLNEALNNTEKQANDIIGDLFTRMKRAKLSLTDTNFNEDEELSEKEKLDLSDKAELVQDIIALTKNDEKVGDSNRRRKHFATKHNLDAINYSDIAANHNLKVNEYKKLNLNLQALIL